MRFPIGTLLLLVFSILIYFGFAHRALDRMRLTDKGALGFLALMVLGSFINIPLPFAGVNASINVGGALLPIGLAIYLLSKAGTSKEWIRALIASVVTWGVLLLARRFLSPEPEGMFIDPLYVLPIIAGITGYLTGRSRRSSFIAATLGVLLLDISHLVYLIRTGIPGRANIGGAGAFDAIVLAGIFAIMLAELIGETRERLQGGPESEGRPKELLEGLQDIGEGNKGDVKNIEYANMIGAQDHHLEQEALHRTEEMAQSAQDKMDDLSTEAEPSADDDTLKNKGGESHE